MSFDGIVTRKIVNEIRKEILGAKIQKISQPSKNDIVFNIYSMGKSYKLLISANNNEARITFTNRKYENPEVPGNFCMVLRKHLNQGKIIDIKQYGLDRVVEFSIGSIDEMGYEKSKKLIVEIMGRHSNIILTDDNYKIIDAIKRVNEQMSSVRQIFPGLNYEKIPSGKIDISTNNFDLSIDKLSRRIPNTMAPYKIFHLNYEGFSPIVGRELIHRAKIDPNISWNLVSEDEQNRLNKELLKLRADIISDNLSSYTYNNDKKIKDFHTIKLSHLDLDEINYPEMSQAIEQFYYLNKSNDRLDQMKKELIKKINKHKKSVKKKINILYENINKEPLSEQYKKNADLLAANLYRIEDKCKEIELENFYENNKIIKITLDPKKSSWDNINDFYNRSKKIKNSIKYAKNDLPYQENFLSYLTQLEDFVNRAENISELEEIKDDMVENKLIKKKKNKKKKVKKSKPYHYKTKQGSDIYIGKNSKQNDYITLKLARKDDLWFHVKDVPGSHVILKSDSINEDEIKIAAYLAGKHSSISEEKYIDIDYTEKKNVNKAKGAKDGMVYYENFKTIRVNMDLDLSKELEKI